MCVFCFTVKGLKKYLPLHIMDALEKELRELLLKKNDPECLTQLYMLLDSVRELANTIEDEIGKECISDDSDSDECHDDDSDECHDDSSDSDISFTKEELKLISNPEQRAFYKRYSLVPK
jgi:hypothetical protein